MSSTPNTRATVTRLTATATLKTTRGKLVGFFVSSTTAGTIVLHDATAATNQFTGTITPAAGAWYPLPVPFRTGLHAVIGGTLDVTFVFE